MLPRTAVTGLTIALPQATRRSHADDLGRLLSLSAVITAMILLLVSGGLLARLQTSVASLSTPGPGMIVAAILLLGATSAIRLMILVGKPGKTIVACIAWTSPTIAFLFIAAATSLPGIRGISWGLTWSVIVATEFGWWLAWFSIGSEKPVSTGSRDEKPARNTLLISPPDEMEALHDELGSDAMEEELNELLPPEMSRRVSRSNTTDKGQRLDILMRLPFSTGQRSQFAHLPIHPPLPDVPDVTCHQLAGPECSISVSESQRFGIRLEFKLSRLPVEEVNIVVQVEAVAPGNHQEAA